MTMPKNTKYSRGSEWRKWDLQVQPIKNSWFPNLNSKTDEIENATRDYLKEAVVKGISVVAITDHNSGHAIDSALKIKKQENLDVTVLPGIEIDVNIGYQFIVIFNPSYKNKIGKPTWKDTVEHFLNNVCRLPSPVMSSSGQAKPIQVEVHEFLNNICKEDIGLPIFAHCQSRKGLFENTTSSNRKEYFTNFLTGKYHFVLDHKTDHNIEKTKDILEDWGINPDKFAYIKTSDAHKATDVGSNFSWIKADPTYEGLKQIIYEPVERLKIQENNPSFEYNKPYFSKIEIKDQVGIFAPSQDQVNFHKTVLPLNKNLVAMIGGRGTGKSMLVDYWGNIFGKNTEEDKGFSSDPHFSIEYSKENVEDTTTVTYDGGNDNHLDFIYIPQSNLKKVSNKNSIDQEVKKLLGLEELHFSKNLTAEIQDILENIDKLSNWFMEEDEDGRRLNNKDYVEAIRTQSQALLDSITTKSNKEKLEKYTDNISAIQALKNNLDYLDRLQLRLESFRKELSEEIAEAHRRFPESDGYKELTTLDFNAQLYGISENRKIAEARKASKESENEAIKSDFEKEGLTGDLSNLLKNAGTHQSWVVWAKGQLKEIEKRKLILENLRNQRDGLATKLKEEYEIQKREIDKAWMNILERHEGQQHKRLIRKILLREDKTSVEGEIVFNEKEFYDKLLEIVDRRSYRDTNALRKHFEISSFEDWVNFVNSNLKKFIDDGAEAEKFPGIKELFFGLKERATYLKTLPKITHNGKRLNLLSVGQRGTVYLCLKLATDAFSTPIIFDQPEDDLDNEFIVAELIDIFRELKEYRQIIIVTHNANLVVNADAEQVIIASNDNEILTYKSGSLENENIIDGVCKILEGGVEAFEKRKHKYRFD